MYSRFPKVSSINLVWVEHFRLVLPNILGHLLKNIVYECQIEDKLLKFQAIFGVSEHLTRIRTL